MASRYTLLPQAAQPVGSNFPELIVDGQERQVLAFDATTNETCDWTFSVPTGWTGTITAKVFYRMASATSGDVDLDIQVEAISDGDSIDTDSASSFDTLNSVDNTTVPGTAGFPDLISITLTNDDSAVAGDMIRIRFNRDAASDTATGDLELFWIEIQDGA